MPGIGDEAFLDDDDTVYVHQGGSWWSVHLGGTGGDPGEASVRVAGLVAERLA
ncbi:hypothetical protein NUM3379_42930 [Kineococcus sp. NUM-3379]